MASRATDATRRSLAAAAESLPLDDTQDFADADRGFIARRAERQIRAADGHVVWDLDAYAFLDGPRPRHGEPEPVAPGPAAGQGRPVRGGARHLPGARLRPLEHHFVEGDDGVIVIDPLHLEETARPRFALYARAPRRRDR